MLTYSCYIASDVPGEGEHKILDRIHYLAQNNVREISLNFPN